MKKIHLNHVRALALGAAAFAAIATSAQTPTQLSLHLDAATRNAAGNADLLSTFRPYYCMFAEDRLDLQAAARADTARVPLTQIFDDVWYLGSRYVGQYIFRNSSGFMMIDSVNNATEATNFTIPALQSLGLSASLPLTDVYLTHGHPDHDGGALKLRQTYNPNIYLGLADANNKSYAPIKINTNILTPQPTSMGGRTVNLLATPGHTAGTVGAVFPVLDGGRQLNAIVVGGSAMTSSIAESRSYLDSVERLYALALQMGVEASVHPHPVFDGTLHNLEKINASGKTTPSQFTVGTDLSLRGLVIYRECSAAWLSKIDATASIPVWRTTKVEFTPVSPSPNLISARLTNDWGPLPLQQVTFAQEGTGAACVATTNADGVATCNTPFGPFTKGVDKITASFSGNSTAASVDLTSKVTATVSNGCSDMTSIRSAIGSRAGDAKYVQRLDMDRNGLIDIRDVAAMARLIAAGTVCQ